VANSVAENKQLYLATKRKSVAKKYTYSVANSVAENKQLYLATERKLVTKKYIFGHKYFFFNLFKIATTLATDDFVTLMFGR